MSAAREAYCCHCDERCGPMIAFGWGVCEVCRMAAVDTYAALKANVKTRRGQQLVRSAIETAVDK